MVKVKICGLCRPQDLEAAEFLGADFCGFIFVPTSPRRLSGTQADRLLERPCKSMRVGVFMNQPISLVLEIFNRYHLDRVQLHGQESPEYCRRLGLPFWKTFHPRDLSDLQLITRYPRCPVLLDNRIGSVSGGTGRQVDSKLVVAALERGRPLILAGGIGPDNLAAIWKPELMAIDINSAIEDKPGIKNLDKMDRLFHLLGELRQKKTQKRRINDKG